MDLGPGCSILYFLRKIADFLGVFLEEVRVLCTYYFFDGLSILLFCVKYLKHLIIIPLAFIHRLAVRLTVAQAPAGRSTQRRRRTRGDGRTPGAHGGASEGRRLRRNRARFPL